MPTLEEKSTGRPDAEVLGWCGPFYLGLFGNVDPQWSIWADEWIHNEDLDRAYKLQRRSPEVWCKEPIERRTMDPIAMLGSETPRLDSGMNLYSLRADGQEVMRYSMGMAVAMPCATNSFVPGSETGKHKYGADNMAFPPKDETAKPPDANAQKTPPTDKPEPAASGDIAAVVQDCLKELMPSIVQAVTIALEFFQGEWFLDTSQGLPFFQSILVKSPDVNLITGFFRAEILAVPGIASLTSLALTYDRQARSLQVVWQAVSSLSGLTIGASTQLQIPGGTA